MPTVLDSFVIELGLDPKKLSKGQQEALDNFKKTNEQAKKQGDLLERQAARTVDSFNAVRRTILGVGALLGVNSFRQYTADIVKSDAALGRLTYTLNQTPEKFSKFQHAIKLGGGTTEGFSASVQSLNSDLQNFALTGESQVMPYLRTLEVKIADDNGKLRDMLDIVRDITAAVEKQSKDPAQRFTLLRQLGFDEGTASVLARGTATLNKLLTASERLGVVSRQNTEQAQKLETAFSTLSITASNFGRYVSELVGPDALKALKQDLEDIERIVRSISSLPSFFKKLFGAEGAKAESGNWWDVRSGFKAFMKLAREHDWSSGRGAAPATPSGAFTSQDEKEKFIRAEAARRGMDPDQAMRVAKSEGFYNFKSAIPGEKSYGAFQLNISKNPARPSLGDRFKADTGLDPSDPATEAQGIKYALDEAKRRGWGQWYGWKGDKWAGIPRGGAGSVANDNSRSSTSTSTSEVNIGTVVVQTQATDANGIARDMRSALENSSLSGQAQSGPN